MSKPERNWKKKKIHQDSLELDKLEMLDKALEKLEKIEAAIQEIKDIVEE